jgi:GTP-binding protein
LVDLPGFGYAKVSKTERFAWQDLIGRYLSLNNDIRLAIHVIDSRHEPTALDLELNRILRSKSVAYILLLNKADKLKQSETSKAKNGISKIFPEIIYGENCFLYSSTNGTGKKEVARLLDVLFGT